MVVKGRQETFQHCAKALVRFDPRKRERRARSASRRAETMGEFVATRNPGTGTVPPLKRCTTNRFEWSFIEWSDAPISVKTGVQSVCPKT